MSDGYESPDTPGIDIQGFFLRGNTLPPDGLPHIRLPVLVAASLYRTVQAGGRRAIYDLFYLALTLRDGAATHEEVSRLFDAAMIFYSVVANRFKNDEGMLLYASYEMLKAKQITREEAAQLASTVLDKPITKDAWRKAVNKWARDQKLPPLDLAHGRPKKEKAENTTENSAFYGIVVV